MNADTRTAPELRNALREAASGLLFPSETDAPFIPIELPFCGPDLTPEALLRAEGRPADSQVEKLSPDELFAPLIEAGDDDAQKYKRLIKLMKSELADLAVYRIGVVDIDIFIVGRHPSGVWLGLKTKAVET